jgi:hypothetical protein
MRNKHTTLLRKKPSMRQSKREWQLIQNLLSTFDSNDAAIKKEPGVALA